MELLKENFTSRLLSKFLGKSGLNTENIEGLTTLRNGMVKEY
jgi:hypothetical protein